MKPTVAPGDAPTAGGGGRSDQRKRPTAVLGHLSPRCHGTLTYRNASGRRSCNVRNIGGQGRFTRYEKDARTQRRHEIAVIDGQYGGWRSSCFTWPERINSADIDLCIRASACSIAATSKGAHGNREHRWRCAWSLVALEDGARPLDCHGMSYGCGFVQSSRY
jgi:hypothetical protein